MAYTAGFSVNVGDPTKASDVTTLAANDDYLKAAVDAIMADSATPSSTLKAAVVLADGVTATTQSAGNNTTRVATTAFVKTAVDASSTDPAGSNTQIQYNNSGAFGASANLTFNGNHLTLGDGDLVIGTSGHGIDFSANSHASGMTGELLDGYEEGTWTPVFKYDTGSGALNGTAYSTGSSNTATYTKIGRLVYVAMEYEITNPSADDDTSTVILTGLPFTAANVSQWWRAHMTISLYTKASSAGPYGAIGQNNTYVAMYKQMINGTWDEDVKTQEIYQSSGSVWIGISGCYHVA